MLSVWVYEKWSGPDLKDVWGMNEIVERLWQIISKPWIEKQAQVQNQKKKGNAVEIKRVQWPEDSAYFAPSNLRCYQS